MVDSFTTGQKNAAQNFEVVYNIYEFAPEFYLLNAYIVNTDKGGFYAHIKQKAISSTISAYGLELDKVRARIFDINEKLLPQNLETRFKTKRRRKISLSELIKDEETLRSIKKYTHSLINEALSLISRNKLPVSWDVERKVLVKDFILRVNRQPLEPHLYFERTATNVKYRFRLITENGLWNIRDREQVIPITNHPAWVMIDHELHQINHVNGNMVKPFRGKDVVIIPNSYVRSYFEKFILKVASKVDIEAKGFDLIEEQELKGCYIQLIKDFSNGQWGIRLKMEYPSSEFLWNEAKEQKTSLNFKEDYEVQIVKIIRDKAGEQVWLDKMERFPLVQGVGNYLVLDPAKMLDLTDESKTSAGLENEYELIEWLTANRAEIESLGFQVQTPVVGDKVVVLDKATIQIGLNQQNDWFDLYGDVVIGKFKIPFIKFADHIKENDRFFELPNGEWFIIPLEWMTKYRTLFKFGRQNQEVLQLAKSQFTILNEIQGLSTELEVETEEDFDFEVSQNLKAQLRPYQLEGVKWLIMHNRNELGACLADDMGLGKTLQTLAVLLFAKENREEEEQKEKSGTQLDLFAPADDEEWLNPLNALIILPASLVFNWEREIKQFAPSLSVYKHTGARRHKDIKVIRRFDVILTTYQTVLRDVDLMRNLEYEYIVLDESQQIKNKDSKIFKAINSLMARHRLSLSGTPIENSLSDLWAQMHFINPNLLGGFTFFKREFITPIERKQDEVKKERLRSLVNPYLLRRTKEEVAKDLPPLSVRVFYSEMSKEQKKVYEAEKSATRNFLLEQIELADKSTNVIVFQSLNKLRQMANHPNLVLEEQDIKSSKFSDVWEQWNVVKKGGHKVLMFSSSVKFLQLFRQEFIKRNEPFSWLTGALHGNERKKAIDKFENDDSVQSFLISIKAGGTGLNLTAADYVFILDPWWNPFIEKQAIARAHRIGQTKNVFAFKFITRGTIEEKILKLQEKKTQLANDIIESVQKGILSKQDIEYLLG